MDAVPRCADSHTCHNDPIGKRPQRFGDKELSCEVIDLRNVTYATMDSDGGFWIVIRFILSIFINDNVGKRLLFFCQHNGLHY